MPLLEVVQNRKVSATIHLIDTTAAQLDQYAAFIKSSADEVIEQALAYVFSKDREFQDYLKSPQAASVSPSLRIRKPGRSMGPSEARRSSVQPASRTTNGARPVEARA